MPLEVGHAPSLRQAAVNGEVPVAADRVARAHAARQRVSESVERLLHIGENIRLTLVAALGDHVLEHPGRGKLADLSGKSCEFPVSREKEPVPDVGWEARRDSKDGRQLPSADNRVGPLWRAA